MLIVDEAHNAESVLSNFVEVSVSQYFCEKIVKCKWPDKITPINFVKWIENVYNPKLQSQINYGSTYRMRKSRKLTHNIQH